MLRLRPVRARRRLWRTGTDLETNLQQKSARQRASGPSFCGNPLGTGLRCSVAHEVAKQVSPPMALLARGAKADPRQSESLGARSRADYVTRLLAAATGILHSLGNDRPSGSLATSKDAPIQRRAAVLRRPRSPLRQGPSQRTMPPEPTKSRSRRQGEKVPWTSDCKASMQS
jgi:hypothetical protein